MAGLIGSVQTGFQAIASDLATAVPDANLHYGVAEFKDFEDGGAFANGIQLDQALTADLSAAQTAIGSWSAGGGGDIPEENLAALNSLATNWVADGGRASAQRIIIYASDTSGWENGAKGFAYPTLQGTIDSLTSQGIAVYALDNVSAGSGLDSPGFSKSPGGPADGRNQGSAITAGTGGQIFYNVDFTNVTDVSNAIVSSVTTGVNTVSNISLTADGNLGTWTVDVQNSPEIGPFGATDSPVKTTFSIHIIAPDTSDTRSLTLTLRADGVALDTTSLSLSTSASTSVDLSIKDQSLWGTDVNGPSFDLPINLLSWSGASASYSIPIPGLWSSLKGSVGIGSGSIGLDFNGAMASDLASIADYPVSLSFSAPASASGGSNVTVSTGSSDIPGETSFNLDTAASILPSAELDLVSKGSLSASLAYNTLGHSTQIFSFNPSLNYEFPLFQASATGDLTGLLEDVVKYLSGSTGSTDDGDGPLTPILQVPTLPDITKSGTVGSTLNATGTADPFVGFKLDISQVIDDLKNLASDVFPILDAIPDLEYKIDKTVPLLGKVELEAELLGIALSAGLGLTETVQYQPQVEMTLTSSDGQTHTGAVGQSFSFTMPASGELDLTASVQLGGSITTTIGLTPEMQLSLEALKASASVLGLSFSLGPVWSTSGSVSLLAPLPLYTTKAFAVSSDPSVAPVDVLSNVVQINTDGSSTAVSTDSVVLPSMSWSPASLKTNESAFAAALMPDLVTGVTEPNGFQAASSNVLSDVLGSSNGSDSQSLSGLRNAHRNIVSD